jgi:hypothetical protein
VGRPDNGTHRSHKPDTTILRLETSSLIVTDPSSLYADSNVMAVSLRKSKARTTDNIKFAGEFILAVEALVPDALAHGPGKGLARSALCSKQCGEIIILHSEVQHPMLEPLNVDSFTFGL